MSENSANGWRLSQEQLGFLEELLGDAIMERAEAKLQASIESAQEELKESLLQEFVALHESGDQGSEPVDEDALLARIEERVPALDEEALLERLQARLDCRSEDDALAPLPERFAGADEDALLARLDARIQERLAEHGKDVDAALASLAATTTGVQAERMDKGLPFADLRQLEDRVEKLAREHAASRRSARGEQDGAASTDSGWMRRRPPLGRLLAAQAALLFTALGAGWVALSGRVDTALEQRSELLADLGTRTASAAEQIRSRADASDDLFEDINAAASEIRQVANADAVRSGIVSDLANSAEFIAATTGPMGPRGPVGMPERVGLAPGRFSFQNTSGATVAVMGQDETGRGHAQIYGQSGAAVAYLGTDNGTEGSVRVRDTSGASEVAVRAGREDSGLAITTNRGQQAYIRARNGRSAEMGVTNQSGDGGVVLRSQGGFGAISVNGMSVHDFAEVFELVSRSGVAPGTVMSIAGPNGKLGPSTWAYDPSVIGVVSGAGGLRSGLTIGTRQDGSNDLPVAMSGQVFVRVNGDGGPIQVGDLLVASTTPGVAMRGVDVTRLPGAVIGKAMGTVSQFPEDEALIRMFVMAR